MIRCPECGAKHGDLVEVCDCGQILTDVVPEEQRQSGASPVYGGNSAEPEGPTGTIGLLRFVAGATLIGGIVAAFILSSETEWLAGVWFASGLVTALLLFAVASHLEMTAEIAGSVRAMRRDVRSVLDDRRGNAGS